MSLTDEQAQEIVSRVLERHGIKITKEQMGPVSSGLAIASDEEFFLVSAARSRNSEHRRRLERLELLDALLSAYWQEENGLHLMAPSGEERGFQSEEDFFLHRKYGRDLLAVLNDLERLRDVERILIEYRPPVDIPNERPTTAKNAGAVCISEALAERGLSTWQRANVIAELFHESEIDDRRQEKIARSLYDKLKRI